MSRTDAPGTGATGAHLGVVTALAGEYAVVRFARSAMCAHCGGCLTVGDKEMQTRVPNTLSARVGDMVEVSIEARSVVLASLAAYCVPLSLLIAGVYVGSRISEIAAALIGLALCACGYVLLRILEPRLRAKQRFTPSMRAVLRKEEETNGA